MFDYVPVQKQKNKHVLTKWKHKKIEGGRVGTHFRQNDAGELGARSFNLIYRYPRVSIYFLCCISEPAFVKTKLKPLNMAKKANPPVLPSRVIEAIQVRISSTDLLYISYVKHTYRR